MLKEKPTDQQMEVMKALATTRIFNQIKKERRELMDDYSVDKYEKAATILALNDAMNALRPLKSAAVKVCV